MSQFATTPAGIQPFGPDPNWARLATYLIGPAGNGIGIDNNGSLLNLFSSSTMAAASPLASASGTISLHYAAPLAVVGGSLTLAYGSPFTAVGGTLGLSTRGALVVSGTSLSLQTASPLGQAGGTLTLQTVAPLYFDSGTGSLGVGIGANISLDGSGNLTVALPVNTEALEQNLGTLTWGVTAPTGLVAATYRWTRQGNLITLFAKIQYTNAGTNDYMVWFFLPGDMPPPATWGNQPNGTYVAFGSGCIGINGLASGTNDSGLSGIYKDNSGFGNWIVEIDSLLGYVNATYAWATLQYIAAP